MSSDAEDHRKMKLKKQEKKMTRIVSKAWSLDRAVTFQEVSNSTTNSSSTSTNDTMDLRRVGVNLDNGNYVLGKKGWEKFAAEIGFVYNQFITPR